MNMEWALKIESLGIEFSRFSAAEAELFVSEWRNDNDSHIYTVSLTRKDGQWRASLRFDDREIGQCSAPSRARCAEMAVGAMRAVLIRGHRKTLRTLKARKARAAEAKAAMSASPLDALARDMREKERELWLSRENKPMGAYAIALMLDAYASRIEEAMAEKEGGAE